MLSGCEASRVVNDSFRWFEAATERHQRATNFLQESARKLSPEQGLTPLYGVGATLSRRNWHE